jgi:hypothetical protein
MRIRQPTCGNEAPSPNVYEAREPAGDVVFHFGPTGLTLLIMVFPGARIRPPAGEPHCRSDGGALWESIDAMTYLSGGFVARANPSSTEAALMREMFCHSGGP